MHIVLPKHPTNQFKPVLQSRQQALKTYCSNIYTVSTGNSKFPWRGQKKSVGLYYGQPCFFGYCWGRWRRPKFRAWDSKGSYMSVLKPNFSKKPTFEIRSSRQICLSINPMDLLSRSIWVLERQIWHFWFYFKNIPNWSILGNALSSSFCTIAIPIH